MTTRAGTSPLGRDINEIIAANTPARINRPVPDGVRIKTVRGGVGTPQNQDNPSSSKLSYASEEFKGSAFGGEIVLEALVADAVVFFGNRAPEDFATTDVNVADNEITEVDHGYFTGDGPFQLTTTVTLPAGLALATDYFAIRVDDDTYRLATTRALALDGTEVDITDQGTGTHTISGVHNLNFAAPAADILDGSAGVLIPAGGSLVIPMPSAVTIASNTGGSVKYYFV